MGKNPFFLNYHPFARNIDTLQDRAKNDLLGKNQLFQSYLIISPVCPIEPKNYFFSGKKHFFQSDLNPFSRNVDSLVNRAEKTIFFWAKGDVEVMSKYLNFP